MKKRVLYAVLGLIGLPVFVIESTAGEATGGNNCENVFGADICIQETQVGSQVTAVGVSVPLRAIEGAPEQTPMVWPPATAAILSFSDAVVSATGFQGVTINWESMGHPPLPFLTPHFDFHFYYIPAGERTAIDCGNDRKPETLPAGFAMPDESLPPELASLAGTDTLIGVCVPEMGMHAIRQTDIDQEGPFDATMIVGYYATSPIFFEPMVSREMLLRRQSFSLDIPPVPGLADQPAEFRAEYDAGSDAYLFSFSGF